ncbi:MAG: hypothetical protein ABR949_10305 [Candidatus Aquilonibacter sp.]
MKQIQASQDARDAYIPVQQKRQEELAGLVHRQEVAKHTAYAIQSEAALAVTEATIEHALSSGDLALARDGVQLALPSPNGAANPIPPEYTQPRLHQPTTYKLNEQFNQRAKHSGGLSGSDPFRDNGSTFYLDLLRNGYQRSGKRDDEVTDVHTGERIAVEGELLPPESAGVSAPVGSVEDVSAR